MPSLEELRLALDRERDRRIRLVSEVEACQQRVRTSTASEGTYERILNLRAGLASSDARIEELERELGSVEQRRAHLERVAQNPASLESGDGAAVTAHDRADSGLPPRLRQAREQGLRAVERMRSALSAEAGDRLVGLVERDRRGADSRYLAAVADPAYARAFAKLVSQPQTAHQLFTDDEGRALRVVNEALAERAMVEGTPNLGGYAVPFVLDPTVVNTSDGSVNPLRELATVTPILSNEWRGITSEGVSASWDPEATEVSDDTPTLEQPTIKAEKLAVFVPFSLELGADFGTLQEELAALLADAKDTLEATAFVTGTGTDQPEGLVSGLASGSLVDTAASGALAIADVYALQEALPPRFQPRATWLAANATANRVYRFAGGGSNEPEPFNEDRTVLLGKPFREVSTISSTVSAGEKVLVYADVRSCYRVVERVGLTVELIPHLLSTVHGRPYGMRGLYAYARVGGGVVADNAARVLRVKS